MRTDVALILVSMGFVPEIDFRAVQTSPTNVNVQWFSGVTMPTEAEIDAAAPNVAANLLGLEHGRAVALLSGAAAEPIKVSRAILIELVKELNRHSTLEDDIFAAVAASASLADFKSRMAAITTRVPQRTKANLITAITAAINAGEADA